MARNTDTLSTRDLASPSQPTDEVTPLEGELTPEGELRDASAPEEQPGGPASDQTIEASRPDGLGRENGGGSLLPADMGGTFLERWTEIQTRFVDEPRGAVEDADRLVASLMQQLADGFAKERERLEAQWGRGEDISTEDLRVALQRYRTFFQRLLST